ncbi:hypothetical protein [Actinoplanes utahensis]|uniref:Uncharacterized protein n=1 Tax=Actinoplanes utahensis TaxID=1869 RepID=A0A0A6X0G2_ACTUT|nr:hypothetical protein [Actinoplanes utahensis]KHD73507.1 hypothetical protein MB27_33655 [Actinoplanes utahensis]GIF33808.1 hypothetical protein Aut01nite_67940 [Actinoplanes utahensis]
MPGFTRLAGGVLLALAMLIAGAPAQAATATAAPAWQQTDPPRPDYQSLNAPQIRAFSGDSAVMTALYFEPVDCDWVCPFSYLSWRWNGTTWTSTPRPPLTSYIGGYVALSPTDQWAFDTGAGGAFRTHRYNGAAWTTTTVPSVKFDPSGAAAAGPDDIWVAGTGQFGTAYKPAIARWNGSTWTVTALPAAAAAGGVEINDIHVAARNEVWVIGDRTSNYTDYQLYAARWNGSTWSEVKTGTGYGRATPVPAAAVTGTPGDIWITGTDPVTGCGLTLRWNGSSFARQNLCQASAVSTITRYGGDWVIGLAPPRTGTAPDGALRRWTGSTWQPITGPHPRTTEVTHLAADPAGGALWAFSRGTDAAGNRTLPELWRLTGPLS